MAVTIGTPVFSLQTWGGTRTFNVTPGVCDAVLVLAAHSYGGGMCQITAATLNAVAADYIWSRTTESDGREDSGAIFLSPPSGEVEFSCTFNSTDGGTGGLVVIPLIGCKTTGLTTWDDFFLAQSSSYGESSTSSSYSQDAGAENCLAVDFQALSSSVATITPAGSETVYRDSGNNGFLGTLAGTGTVARSYSWTGSVVRAGGHYLVAEGAAAAVPEITDVTPSTVTPSSNPVITGTNFEATQGTGVVTISPTDNVADVAAETQTIAASGWDDTEITLDGVTFPTGTAHNDTLYLFVTNADGETNAAGYVLAAYLAPILTNPTQVNIGSTVVTPRVTTTVGNGTAYYVIFPQTDSDPDENQIAAGNGADDEPAAFSGSMAVDTAGVLTFPEVTGLDPATAYRIGYTHNGDPNA